MAGLLKHTWETVVKGDSGTALAAGSVIITGSAEFNEKVTVASGATEEMDLGTIDKDTIVSLCLVSDKDVTVDTNAADATGGQEILLKAGHAYAWNNQQGAVNPITANITAIFVKNSGTDIKPATFRAAFLMDLLV